VLVNAGSEPTTRAATLRAADRFDLRNVERTAPVEAALGPP